MSRKLWVTWQGTVCNSWRIDKVIGLEDDADITDLRRAFVHQQNLNNVPPGEIDVCETKDGDPLEEDTALSIYFVPPMDTAAAAGPGKSEMTPL